MQTLDIPDVGLPELNKPQQGNVLDIPDIGLPPIQKQVKPPSYSMPEDQVQDVGSKIGQSFTQEMSKEKLPIPSMGAPIGQPIQGPPILSQFIEKGFGDIPGKLAELAKKPVTGWFDQQQPSKDWQEKLVDAAKFGLENLARPFTGLLEGALPAASPEGYKGYKALSGIQNRFIQGATNKDIYDKNNIINYSLNENMPVKSGAEIFAQATGMNVEQVNKQVIPYLASVGIDLLSDPVGAIMVFMGGIKGAKAVKNIKPNYQAEVTGRSFAGSEVPNYQGPEIPKYEGQEVPASIEFPLEKPPTVTGPVKPQFEQLTRDASGKPVLGQMIPPESPLIPRGTEKPVLAENLPEPIYDRLRAQRAAQEIPDPNMFDLEAEVNRIKAQEQQNQLKQNIQEQVPDFTQLEQETKRAEAQKILSELLPPDAFQFVNEINNKVEELQNIERQVPSKPVTGTIPQQPTPDMPDYFDPNFAMKLPDLYDTSPQPRTPGAMPSKIIPVSEANTLKNQLNRLQPTPEITGKIPSKTYTGTPDLTPSDVELFKRTVENIKPEDTLTYLNTGFNFRDILDKIKSIPKVPIRKVNQMAEDFGNTEAGIKFNDLFNRDQSMPKELIPAFRTMINEADYGKQMAEDFYKKVNALPANEKEAVNYGIANENMRNRLLNGETVEIMDNYGQPVYDADGFPVVAKGTKELQKVLLNASDTWQYTRKKSGSGGFVSQNLIDKTPEYLRTLYNVKELEKVDPARIQKIMDQIPDDVPGATEYKGLMQMVLDNVDSSMGTNRMQAQNMLKKKNLNIPEERVKELGGKIDQTQATSRAILELNKAAAIMKFSQALRDSVYVTKTAQGNWKLNKPIQGAIKGQGTSFNNLIEKVISDTNYRVKKLPVSMESAQKMLEQGRMYKGDTLTPEQQTHFEATGEKPKLINQDYYIIEQLPTHDALPGIYESQFLADKALKTMFEEGMGNRFIHKGALNTLNFYLEKELDPLRGSDFFSNAARRFNKVQSETFSKPLTILNLGTQIGNATFNKLWTGITQGIISNNARYATKQMFKNNFNTPGAKAFESVGGGSIQQEYAGSNIKLGVSDFTVDVTNKFKAPETFKDKAKKIVEIPWKVGANLYQGSEIKAKGHIFFNELEKMGYDISDPDMLVKGKRIIQNRTDFTPEDMKNFTEAMDEANYSLIDYGRQSKMMKAGRATFIPLSTFYWNMIPRMAKAAAGLDRKGRFDPMIAMRFYAVPGALALLNAASEKMANVTDDERRTMGESSRGFNMTLPMRDEKGNPQTMDLNRILPFYSAFARGGGALKIPSMFLPSGPIGDAISKVKSGVDPYTQKEIISKSAPVGKQWAQAGYQAFKTMLPYPTNMIENGLLAAKGISRKAGQPPESIMEVIGENMLPVKRNTIDVEQTKSNQAYGYKKGIEDYMQKTYMPTMRKYAGTPQETQKNIELQIELNQTRQEYIRRTWNKHLDTPDIKNMLQDLQQERKDLEEQKRRLR